MVEYAPSRTLDESLLASDDLESLTSDDILGEYRTNSEEPAYECKWSNFNNWNNWPHLR